jgi:uncharacterized DUF497 family protein
MKEDAFEWDDDKAAANWRAHTERGEHIRLISARRAEKHEQDHYYRENSI